MEELLIILIQFIFEVLLNVLCSSGWDLGSGTAGSVLAGDSRVSGGWWLALLAVVAGSCLGGLSLWMMPMTLIAVPALRMANLVVSPLVAGYSTYGLAAWRISRGSSIHLPTHVVGSVCFTLGLVCVRFAYGHHPS